MSDDFQQNGHARRPKDVAIEQLPADLEEIYDQLTHDSEGWARRLPEASSLQEYARAFSTGTAMVDTAARPAGLEESHHHADDGADGAPASGGTERWAAPPDGRRSRGAMWASAVSAMVIVALLAGAFALLPRIRGTSGLTTATATATPTAASCAPDQISLTLPANAQLEQLAMTSPTEGWAFGRTVTQVDQAEEFNPVLLHFHQCQWTPVPPPLPGADAYLSGISMATAADGWAAGWESTGTSGRCVLLHYTGGEWRPVELPTAIPQQEGVSSSCGKIRMFSPDEGWLLASWRTQDTTDTTHLFHYTRGTWTLVDSPVSQAFDIAAVGPGGVWVAGTRSPADSDPNRMMLVDVAHYDRGQWTTFHLPAGGGGWLTMNSPTDGWFVSAALPTQVLHYDGVAWQPSPFTDHASADGSVTVFDGGDAWTIATTTGTYPGYVPKVASMQHYAGGQWQTVQWPFPDDTMLFTPLTRVAPGEYWAVGFRANGPDKSTWKWLLLHYVSGAWHEYGA